MTRLTIVAVTLFISAAAALADTARQLGTTSTPTGEKKKNWRITELVINFGSPDAQKIQIPPQCAIPLSEGKELKEMLDGRTIENIDHNKIPGAQFLPGAKSVQQCNILGKSLNIPEGTAAAETRCKITLSMAGSVVLTQTTHAIANIKKLDARNIMVHEFITIEDKGVSSHNRTHYELCP